MFYLTAKFGGGEEGRLMMMFLKTSLVFNIH